MRKRPTRTEREPSAHAFGKITAAVTCARVTCKCTCECAKRPDTSRLLHVQDAPNQAWVEKLWIKLFPVLLEDQLRDSLTPRPHQENCPDVFDCLGRGHARLWRAIPRVIVELLLFHLRHAGPSERKFNRPGPRPSS